MNDVTVPEGTIPAATELAGLAGTAFSIIGAVRRGLREAGNPPEILKSFSEQAMEGDYDHLLRCAIAFTTEPTPEAAPE